MNFMQGSINLDGSVNVDNYMNFLERCRLHIVNQDKVGFVEVVFNYTKSNNLQGDEKSIIEYVYKDLGLRDLYFMDYLELSKIISEQQRRVERKV